MIKLSQNSLTKRWKMGTSKRNMLEGCKLFCFPLNLSILLLESKYWTWQVCYCLHTSIQHLFLAWISDSIVVGRKCLSIVTQYFTSWLNICHQTIKVDVWTIYHWEAACFVPELQYDRQAEKALPDSRFSSCTKENHIPNWCCPICLQN